MDAATAKGEDELKKASDLVHRFGSAEDIAHVNRVLAGVEIGRGNWPPAEEYLRGGVSYVRKAGVRADPEFAHDCIDNLRRVLWFRYGHTPEVESLGREALAIARTTPSRGGFFLALDLASLAMYLADENRFAEAEPLLKEALEVQRGMPHLTSAMCTTLDTFAMIAAKRGDLAAAERYYRESRDTALLVWGMENPNTIVSIAEWGRTWATLGHSEEAVEEMAKAVEAAHKLFPNGSPRVSPVYNDYAYVLNMLKRSKEAEAYARESLASLPTTDVGRAAPKLELGVALVLQKRFQEAIPLLEESQRVYANYSGSGPRSRLALRAQQYLEKARAGL